MGEKLRGGKIWSFSFTFDPRKTLKIHHEGTKEDHEVKM